MNKTNWINYWDKKNIWTESGLWKKNIELFFKKTYSIFNYDKKNIVLDIGCGNGDFANKISDRVDQVYCVDTSQEYVNICKARFSNNKNTVKRVKNLQFVFERKTIKVSTSIIFHYLIEIMKWIFFWLAKRKR